MWGKCVLALWAERSAAAAAAPHDATSRCEAVSNPLQRVLTLVWYHVAGSPCQFFQPVHAASGSIHRIRGSDRTRDDRLHVLDVNGVDGALRCVGAAQVHVYRSVRLTESAVVSGKLQLSLLLVSHDITGFIGRWDRFRFFYSAYWF